MCLWAIGTLMAEEPSVRDSVHTIDEIVVHAQQRRLTLAPSQLLTRGELTRLGALSVADALRYYSGVQIKDYGGIGGLKTINVRSMGSHHVGVFYDGVQLGNAQNGIIDLGRFSLENMETISVYNGQKSQLLQSARDYASSSALYLRSRRPSFDLGRQNNINVGLRVGSFHTLNPSLLWEHRLSPRTDLSLSGEYLYTSGQYPFRYRRKDGYDTTALRQNGDVRALRTELGLYHHRSHGRYTGKLYLYNSERGYPGAVVREVPGLFRNQDRQWDTNLLVQGTMQYEPKGRYQMQVLGKYAYDYLHYISDPRLDVSTMYIDNRYHQHEAYLSVAQLITLDQGWGLALSTDAQYNAVRADLTDFAYPHRAQLLSALSGSYSSPRLSIQTSLLHTLVRDATKHDAPQWRSILSPSIVASWQPWANRGLSLRAFYKHIFRLPTLSDLYYTFIGNKLLNPEYTVQYNVGAVWRRSYTSTPLRTLELQADAYYNRVRDKIVAMPTSNQFRWTMLNFGLVDIVGLDLSASATIQLASLRLMPRLSYTYQQASEHTNATSPWYGGQIPYVPWHAGSVTVGADWQRWVWSYSFIYTGERYHSVANLQEFHIQPWYTHDLSLSYTWQLSSLKLVGTLEVNNLLNQQYEVVKSYPMPGTNFRLKLNAIF